MNVFKSMSCSNCTIADEPMGISLNECPAGYICDMERRRQANCSIIRQNYINLGFGDVIGGSLCPRGIHSLQNCPIGHFCPNPNTSILCPEGFFCPHKSLYHAIRCQGCKAGSAIFKRNMWGYIICSLVVLCIGINYLYRIFISRSRHQSAVQDEESHRRSIRPNVASIYPLLEDIFKRIGYSNECNGSRDEFDAGVLFDFCDVSHIDVVSYENLNQIMQLDPNQLDRFRIKMNECACLDLTNCTVTREVFILFFIEATIYAVNFSPNSHQVVALFDEIWEQQSSIQDADTIDMFGMYDSSISSFLTEEQISYLVRHLKCSINQMDGSDENGSIPRSLTIQEPTHLDISSSSEDTVASSSEVMVSKFQRILETFRSKCLALKNVAKSSGDTIRKMDFIRCYPEALASILDQRSTGMRTEGIDIYFENLCLEVVAGGKRTVVVDRVTGRIHRGAMTALMGCSGAGKTSLLNALCGRAYYGKINGIIKINGHETCIEQHRDAIGFVPQDDIVYSELTVRENLVFAGKFRLPRGTSLEEIDYIADKTMTSLGLTRVAHSIVGDVTIRGISGGEKKRLNIGIEMMAQPSILFLDEPTSGLDATSALQVMKALKDLVKHQGVTVCSAIHQPRKFIFELFDCLILLGLGGKILYHGPTMGAAHYFTKLHYVLPPSESVADWLLDISSGHVKSVHSIYQLNGYEKILEDYEVISYLHDEWERYLQRQDGDESKAKFYSLPEMSTLPASRLKIPLIKQLSYHISRNFLGMIYFKMIFFPRDVFGLLNGRFPVSRRNLRTKLIDTAIIVGGIFLVAFFVGEFKPTKDFPPDVRNEYYVLTSTDRITCSQAMPDIFKVATFSECKTFALSASAITSTLIALTASKAITEKREEFFREIGSGYNINPFFVAINISTTMEQGLQAVLASLVAFWLRNSLCHWVMYAIHFLFLGWISVSWGLFFAIIIPPKNVVLVIGFFMLFGSLLLSGVSPPIQYFGETFMSILYFFLGMTPTSRLTFPQDIYSNKSIAILSGIFSPTRYFIEAIIVSEYRVLPPQYGFSMGTSTTEFSIGKNMFVVTSLAQNNFPRVAFWSPNNTFGWFWGLLPSFFVGLTVRLAANLAIITSSRSKQIKGSLWKELKTSRSCRICFLCLSSAFCLSFGVTVLTILQ